MYKYTNNKKTDDELFIQNNLVIKNTYSINH